MVDEVPVKKVLELRAKGLDNEKIISELKNQNYNYKQIRDALEQANIKKTVLGSPSGQAPQQPAAVPAAAPPAAKPAAPMTTPMQQAPAQAPAPSARHPINVDEVQRIIEEIIEEKWDESDERLKKLEDWKNEFGAKVGGFEKRLDDFSNSLSSMQGVLSEKAEEFSESMQSVDTEMKALEKALNRIVPSLSDNIKELRDIVGDMKK